MVTKPGQARKFAKTFVFALQFRFYTSYDNKWEGNLTIIYRASHSSSRVNGTRLLKVS
jgi:hypothetical protein